MNNSIDILMITYNRAEYTAVSLERLLDTCDDNMRVWVWHNGNDQRTLEVVKSMQNHPNFYKFHHSLENKKLNEPTNWLWKNAKGEYFTKVDDDCLMPYGWADKLRKAHEDNPEFGVIGCWRFPDEDFVPQIAEKKIKKFKTGHRLMQNCWVEGSGYLMKRQCVDVLGFLKKKNTFTTYCNKLAYKGYINGWYYPFLYQEHFDDPRSNHTLLRSDADLKKFLPLSAKNFGVESIQQWLNFLKNDAYLCQCASINPKNYIGWRPKLRRLLVKLGLRKVGTGSV